MHIVHIPGLVLKQLEYSPMQYHVGMKSLLIMVVGFFSWFTIGAQCYRAEIDLKEVQNDRVKVRMMVQEFNLSKTEFHMPAMVPGMYAVSNFGRVVHDLVALDTMGNSMQIERLDTNRWRLTGQQPMALIEYWVDDTYDGAQFSSIFEPGGTNIQEDTNFVINAFGFLGFFKGHENYPYTVEVIHPSELFGTCPLPKLNKSKERDVYTAEHYYQLVDSPMMFCKADTSSILLGNTKVIVSVYSPVGNMDAEFAMEQVKPTLIAQGKYLGGELPVDNYVIMIYLTPGFSPGDSYGALEHAYSTVFYLPDVNGSFLKQTLVDVTSHEFFHIITPLTIHSEEIGSYNFVEPTMSKHLWLYEGVTEYSAMIMQVQYGLISVPDFLDEIMNKKEQSMLYNDTLPFTELSLGALDNEASQYPNVYLKGALIGLCLDLTLLELSEGTFGIKELLDTLALKYGKDRSFKDEDLFDEIAAITYPEIRSFFEDYVEGKKALPLSRSLNYAGYTLQNASRQRINTLGGVALGLNQDNQSVTIVGTERINNFGKEMGFQVGDTFVSLNKQEITMDSFNRVFDSFLAMEEGEKLVIEIVRNTHGKEKRIKLKGKVVAIEQAVPGIILDQETISEKQLRVRNAWMKPI
jgi:predicted metalloprotease with PDZ domain